MTRLYLAGPDVFFQNAREVGQQKKDLCSRHGLEGVFPLDAELTAVFAGSSVSKAIYQSNIRAILEADAVIANLTPFRGVSADPGTVFEVAYALALEKPKPVFCYASVSGDLRSRVAQTIGLSRPVKVDGRIFADDDMAIEDFELLDNLMIVEAVRAQGWDIVKGQVPSDPAALDVAAFEACLEQATKFFAAKRADAAAAK